MFTLSHSCLSGKSASWRALLSARSTVASLIDRSTTDGPTGLARERAASVAGPRKQIILTFVNRVRLDFAFTWVAHVRRLKLSNWLVGATDEAAFRHLQSASTPCFSMRTNLPQGEWDWGSPSFKALDGALSSAATT